MDKADIEQAAEALARAEKSRIQIPPLSVTYPTMTVSDAYSVQKAWIDLKLAAGRRISGHKIGLTSRAMQRLVNFNEPDYGTLLDDMFYEDGAEIPVDRFITPLLECELAFILAKDLSGPNCTMIDVLAATEYVQPALEIVDLRTAAEDPSTGIKRSVLDNIADNAANGALVLGGRPMRPDAVDLRWVGAICRRNLVIEETGVAAAVLNHPARGVEWLANKLGAQGVSLQKGQVVLGGSFTRVIEARAGDQFHVDYGPLGSVSCSFI